MDAASAAEYAINGAAPEKARRGGHVSACAAMKAAKDEAGGSSGSFGEGNAGGIAIRWWPMGSGSVADEGFELRSEAIRRDVGYPTSYCKDLNKPIDWF